MFANSESLVPSVFFAYPSAPAAIPDVFRRAASEINRTRQLRAVLWEDLAPTGKIVIEEVCRSIAGNQVFAADLTHLNPNVLFELGYAIAQNLRIWLLADTSVSSVKPELAELRLFCRERS